MTGWATYKLGEVCEFLNRGIAPKYIEDGGICIVNQKCIRNHIVNYDFAKRHDNTQKLVKAERIIRRGDVLVNSTGTGTLGRVAQVRYEPPEPATVDTHVTIVRPKADLFYPEYFGYLLISIEEKIKEAGVGSVGQTALR